MPVSEGRKNENNWGSWGVFQGISIAVLGRSVRVNPAFEIKVGGPVASESGLSITNRLARWGRSYQLVKE
jgi:hypothetical protein